MYRRRRNVPWIQRQSRFIIGIIAVVGLILTAYLTITKLTGGEVACTADASAGACSGVLNSAYAYPLDPQGKTGPPLSLFGSLAYLGMAVLALAPLTINPDKKKELRQQTENWTWWLILIGGFSMATFSGYLMYILAFELQTVCYYCIGSALFSLALLVLSILGKEWDDIGQILFVGVAIVLVTLVGSLGIYAGANQANVDVAENLVTKGVIPPAQGQAKPPKGWDITTVSGSAEIALAKHLSDIGAVKYGAFWCPHCYDQKQLFGKEAFDQVNYTECAEGGINANPDACINAGIRSFPTWVINTGIWIRR